MNENSIHKLMSQYRETGRADDLGALFDEVAPTLFQTALHISKDAQAAEDLLQETFLAIMGAVHRWNPKKKASPWITGILRREAQNKGRRDRRRPAPERLIQKDPASPSSASEKLEMNSILRDAVNGLPDLYREVVSLVLSEGAAPAEIAARLDSTPGAIRTRLHRGIALLRESLPSSVAIPVALLAFQSTSLGAVRTSILSQTVPVKVAVTVPVVIAKVAAALVAVVLVVGIVIETRNFLDDGSEETLIETAGVGQETDGDSNSGVDHPDLVVRRTPKDVVEKAKLAQSTTILRSSNVVSIKIVPPLGESIIRRGSFAMHYQQGYSFESMTTEPKEESDLWFATCAGGISSITYFGKHGLATYPRSLRGKMIDGQPCSADCYFRSVVALDEEKTNWGTEADCMSGIPHSDVFVVKTEGGGYVLCAVRERHGDSGWQENNAVVDYVWNSNKPEFNQDGNWTEKVDGFAIDMDAFLTDPGAKAAESKVEAEVDKLEALIAKYKSPHKNNQLEGNVGVALYYRLSKKQTKDWRLAYRYSSFDFSMKRKEHTQRLRWNGDFEYQDHNGNNIRLCTVTDDRSRGWNLGNRDYGAWSADELRGDKVNKWLKAVPGDLLLIHSLDGKVDRWNEVKILEVIQHQAIVFSWKPIKDTGIIEEIMESQRDLNSEMKHPEVRIQMRGGAGGGNPNRAFFDGSKNAYVDHLVESPFFTTAPVSISEKHRAWVDGGLIPYGRVWVVTGVKYDATCVGDSNGPGEFSITIGGKKIVEFRNEKDRKAGTWQGEIIVKPGDEKRCFVEIANSSSADVVVRGFFKDL